MTRIFTKYRFTREFWQNESMSSSYSRFAHKNCHMSGYLQSSITNDVSKIVNLFDGWRTFIQDLCDFHVFVFNDSNLVAKFTVFVFKKYSCEVRIH